MLPSLNPKPQTLNPETGGDSRAADVSESDPQPSRGRTFLSLVQKSMSLECEPVPEPLNFCKVVVRTRRIESFSSGFRVQGIVEQLMVLNPLNPLEVPLNPEP